MDAIGLIRNQIGVCESEGVEILCCPEAILGGLADYAPHPFEIAIDVKSGGLDKVLGPLASDMVTTIVGFTEIDETDRLYNSAAVFHRGSIVGLYRKMHPAIRKSVYEAGDQTLVFQIGGLTFGILICNDSNFPELAKNMTAQGATALFIPTNNGLPVDRKDVTVDARNVDIAIATENHVTVIRADVAGRIDGKVAYGTSAIVDPTGKVLGSGCRLKEDLIIAGI